MFGRLLVLVVYARLGSSFFSTQFLTCWLTEVLFDIPSNTVESNRSVQLLDRLYSVHVDFVNIFCACVLNPLLFQNLSLFARLNLVVNHGYSLFFGAELFYAT